MLAIRSKRRAAALMAIPAGVLLAASLEPAPLEARPPTTKSCLAAVEGQGHGKTMSAGLQRARASWINKVTAAHGATYANPGIADTSSKAPAPACRIVGPVYRCTFRARPCAYVHLTPSKKLP